MVDLLIEKLDCF